METLNSKIQALKSRRTAQPNGGFVQLILTVHLFFRFLFPILSCALLLSVGPAALRTVVNASSWLLHGILEICRLSLSVLNLFGK